MTLLVSALLWLLLFAVSLLFFASVSLFMTLKPSFGKLVFRRGALRWPEQLRAMCGRKPERQVYKWIDAEPVAERPWDWWYVGYQWGGICAGYTYKGERH